MNIEVPRDRLERFAAILSEVKKRELRTSQARRGGLIEFVRYFWDVLEPQTPLVDGWPLEAICTHLEAVTYGEIHRLLANVCPGFMKSLIVNVFWPAWEWGPMDLSHMRYVSFSYAASLTLRDNGRFRDLLISQKYKQLWGHKFNLRTIGVEKIANDKTGWKLASSVGGVGTGERGDRVCFPANEKVWTENGPRPIGGVVNSKSNFRIWSTNIETGQTELRRITGWHRNPASDLVRVSVSGNGFVRCTPDHKFWTQRGWVEASRLRTGDVLPYLSRANAENDGLAHAKNSSDLSARPFHTKDGQYIGFGKFGVADSGASHDGGRVFGSMMFCSGSPVSVPERQIKMSPRSSISNARNCLMRHPVFNGKFFRRFFMPFCNFSYFLASEIWGTVSKRTMPLAVSDVIGSGSIFEVVQSSDSSVPVFMADLLSLWAWANKSRRHELMNKNIFAFAVAPHCNARVSIVEDWSEEAARNSHRVPFAKRSSWNTEDAPVSRNAVVWEPNGIGPDFRTVVSVESDGHVDETFCLTVEGNHTMYCGSVPVLVSNCLDDPHNVKEAESEVVRTETVRWFRESLSNRLNDIEKSAMVIIMQRVNEGDVSGTVLSSDFDYCHLMIPMEYDPLRSKETDIGWVDPREHEGELAWPERFSEETVEKLKRELGPYAYAAQYQQSPEPRGGGIIKREWWQLWPSDAYPQCEYVLASLDTAYTEKQENDASALTIWGVFRDADGAPRVVLMYAWQGRLSLHDLVIGVGTLCSTREMPREDIDRIAAILKLNFVPRFGVDRLIIETKASGISVMQELARLYSGSGDFGVEGVDPSKWGDKTARLYAVQHLFSDGMIYAPDRKFADMVIDNVSVFPKGDHDDLTDSTSLALRYLRLSGLLQRKEEHSRDLTERLTFKSKEKGLYW